MSSIIDVWTDGSSIPNPGKGGWAWTTMDGRQRSGAQETATNQQMELRAVLEAIRSLGEPGRVLHIHTDSQYVIKGMEWWTKNWVKNGWMNSKGEPVKNKELWQELLTASTGKSITYTWVKGHSGDIGNEEADRLAVEASGVSSEELERCNQRWYRRTKNKERNNEQSSRVY